MAPPPSDAAMSSADSRSDPTNMEQRMRSYTAPDPSRPDALRQDGLQQQRETAVLLSKQISSPEVVCTCIEYS